MLNFLIQLYKKKKPKKVWSPGLWAEAEASCKLDRPLPGHIVTMYSVNERGEPCDPSEEYMNNVEWDRLHGR